MCFLFLFISISVTANPILKLNDAHLEIISLEPFNTNGATDCSYYILHTEAAKYFVKTGEKVDKEIRNITFLYQNNVTCIPFLISGSSEENQIMISEFISHSDYGLQMIKDFHANIISNEDFLAFQSKALNLLKYFYKIKLPEDTSESIVFAHRANQRMNDLLRDQDEIIVDCDTGKIKLSSIINTPIIYQEHNKRIEFPNLVELVYEFNNMVYQLPALKKFVLHGDFHAPNLCMNDHQELILVDLSDIMYGEEAAWDLGKWLNHVTRLYRVVENRTKKEPDPLISFSLFQSNIYLENHHKTIPLELVRNEAVKQFASMIEADINLTYAKAAAAEFIVNISTLRRHMMRFPNSTRGVLICILTSFLEFKDKFEKYTETMPK